MSMKIINNIINAYIDRVSSLPTVGSLVDNRAYLSYFALCPGGTSSLEQTPVPLAAHSSRTVCISTKYT